MFVVSIHGDMTVSRVEGRRSTLMRKEGDQRERCGGMKSILAYLVDIDKRARACHTFESLYLGPTAVPVPVRYQLVLSFQ
jgi:hypothetical protein